MRQSLSFVYYAISFFLTLFQLLEGSSIVQVSNNNLSVLILPLKSGFRERGLEIHNYYRKLNKAEPLQLSEELNKFAHACSEKMSSRYNMTSMELGFRENLWSYRGELLPLAKDVEYAVKSWYTGSTIPGRDRVQVSIDHDVLRSNFVKEVGFGVGTSDHGGEGFTVVVALYQ